MKDQRYVIRLTVDMFRSVWLQADVPDVRWGALATARHFDSRQAAAIQLGFLERFRNVAIVDLDDAQASIAPLAEPVSCKDLRSE